MRTCCIAQGTLLNAFGDLNGKGIQKRGHICINGMLWEGFLLYLVSSINLVIEGEPRGH